MDWLIRHGSFLLITYLALLVLVVTHVFLFKYLFRHLQKLGKETIKNRRVVGRVVEQVAPEAVEMLPPIPPTPEFPAVSWKRILLAPLLGILYIGLMLPIAVGLYHLKERFWPDAPTWLPNLLGILMGLLGWQLYRSYEGILQALRTWARSPAVPRFAGLYERSRPALRLLPPFILLTALVYEGLTYLMPQAALIKSLWQSIPLGVGLLMMVNWDMIRDTAWVKRLPLWGVWGALLLTTTVWLLFVALFLRALSTFGILVTVLTFFGTMLFLQTGWFAVQFWLPSHWVGRALRQANYEAALRRVQRLYRWKYCEASYVHGRALLCAGRYEEAEEKLRESLTQNFLFGSLVQRKLQCLSETLAGQGRYEEAVQVLEGAMDVNIQGYASASTLAEVLLRQSQQPARALDLLRSAEALYQRMNPVDRWLERRDLPELLANRAWALAALNRREAAAEALEQAFEKANRKERLLLAGLHERAGQVYRLLEEPARAVEHFHLALELDPEGQSGQRASQAMEAMERLNG